MSSESKSASAPLLVACLCAQWCGVCREYQPLFDSLQKEFRHATFRWVDVEDESDLVDPVEVENFPTLLITQGGKTQFFGTVTPHLETLRRLIRSSADATASSITDPSVIALTQRLMSR